jgi:hypothetical protein
MRLRYDANAISILLRQRSDGEKRNRRGGVESETKQNADLRKVSIHIDSTPPRYGFHRIHL